MQIRGRGNTVAIALAALAVVIAATGTAVAVTATQVNIADPSTPTRKAHVDSSGRLTTAGTTSTIDFVATAGIGAAATDVFLTSGTSATLAITHFSASTPPTNSTYVIVDLYQVPANADGTCSQSGSLRLLTSTFLPTAQATTGGDYASPLVVKAPAGGSKYCLDAFLISGDGSDVFVSVQFAGYVLGGTYSGPGSTVVGAAKVPPSKQHVNR